LALLYGLDIGVVSRCHLGWINVVLGNLDQAVHFAEDSVAMGEKARHFMSLAGAHWIASFVHILRQEMARARHHVDTAIAMGRERDLPMIVMFCRLAEGAIISSAGEPERAVPQIQGALAGLKGVGYAGGGGINHHALAEALRAAGRLDEALGVINDALADCLSRSERGFEAELHRLMGEVLLDTGDATEAEACFHRALEVARAQNARFWELRAATSLARLWFGQGKRREALDLLAPVYGWFTEGFDTTDLKTARALLDELG
jgi:tetratricopeptide (TPR) repeat protein